MARYLRQLVFAAFLATLTEAACGEVFLTAEVAPTPGMEGFSTYVVTATSNVGKMIAFDFGQHAANNNSTGIFGPMFQFGGNSIFDPSAVGMATAPELEFDSRFLFPSSDVLTLGTAESGELLAATFATIGSTLQQASHSMPLVQITTNSPEAVRLVGAINSKWTEDPYDALIDEVDIRLADITIGAAPDLSTLPVFVPPTPKPAPIPVPVTPVVEPPSEPEQPTPQPIPEKEPPAISDPDVISKLLEPVELHPTITFPKIDLGATIDVWRYPAFEVGELITDADWTDRLGWTTVQLGQERIVDLRATPYPLFISGTLKPAVAFDASLGGMLTFSTFAADAATLSSNTAQQVPEPRSIAAMLLLIAAGVSHRLGRR